MLLIKNSKIIVFTGLTRDKLNKPVLVMTNSDLVHCNSKVTRITKNTNNIETKHMRTIELRLHNELPEQCVIYLLGKHELFDKDTATQQSLVQNNLFYNLESSEPITEPLGSIVYYKYVYY